jgi:hypothetical protein
LPWEEHQAEIVRFGPIPETAGDSCFTTSSRIFYGAKNRRVLIDWPLGTIVVTRPKTLEFYEQFSNHRATLLRAEGKDILSVRMHLNSERQAEEDVQAMASED